MSAFLERLRKYREDRGVMASLRCVLVDSKRHRAWPALNRVGIAIGNQVSAYVAGLFATHPEETSRGNFGDTCKSIEFKRGERRTDDSKVTPTERRFQQLLSSEPGAELHERVLHMVLMARSQGVPINYGKLDMDLRFWDERARTEWAGAFWAQGTTEMAEEDI